MGGDCSLLRASTHWYIALEQVLAVLFDSKDLPKITVGRVAVRDVLEHSL